MSKQTRAQSKTGKLDIVIERIENDKAEVEPVQSIGGAVAPKKGRIKVKRVDSVADRGKGSDGDSGSGRKRGKRNKSGK